MTTKTRRNMPAGAVPLDNREDLPNNYEPRTGAERVQEIAPDVFAIWPSNRNSKATPEHGPFDGTCRESGRTFVYYTHVLPDRDGIFAPARYDLHPETFAARIDEAQARRANLPPALQALIQAQRSR